MSLLLLLLLICTAHQATSSGSLSFDPADLAATDVKPLLLAQEGDSTSLLQDGAAAARGFSNSVLAYITPWNAAGYETAVRWRHKLTHVSPVWYQLRPAAKGQQGFALVGGHDVDQGWMQRLRGGGTQDDGTCSTGSTGSQTCSSSNGEAGKQQGTAPLIVPRVIFELGPQSLLQLLQQPAQALDLLVTEVAAQGFDGLVVETWLQWAGMGALDDDEFRAAAVAMLAWLADRLHKQHKVLLLAVPPVVPAQPGRPAAAVAHLQQLAGRIDGWSMMLYDFSASGPGPNAPLRWQEENVAQLLAPLPAAAAGAAKHAAAALPASGILMGVPFYGYDWTRPDDGSTGGRAKQQQQQQQAAPIMGKAFLALLRKFKPKLTWEADAAEHRLRVKEDGVRHTIYYPTPAALKARVALAEKLGVGLSIWELGQGIEAFMHLL